MTDRELIAAIAARLVSEARDGKLVAADLNVDPKHLQLQSRLLTGTVRLTRQRK